MSRLSRVFGCGLVLAAGVILAGTARADTINLVNFGNVNWDINASPTTSPSVTVQIENAVASSDLIFNAYDLNLVYIRTSGSGAITVGTAANPLSNSIVPAWIGDPALAGNYINNYALLQVNYAVPNVATNLVTLGFKPNGASPAAGSVFQVWADHGATDYVATGGSGIGTPYANCNSTNFMLGTITITGGVVIPEPGTLVLLSTGGLALLVLALRRRKG